MTSDSIGALLLLCAALLGSGLQMRYTHEGRVARVVDGDTLDVVVTLRPGLTETQRIRLECGDAAELHADGGQEARTALVSAVGDGGVTVNTQWMREKYGRLLADVRADGRTQTVCQELLDAGVLRVNR